MQYLCVFERVVNPQGFFIDVGTKCEDAILCENEVFSSYSPKNHSCPPTQREPVNQPMRSADWGVSEPWRESWLCTHLPTRLWTQSLSVFHLKMISSCCINSTIPFPLQTPPTFRGLILRFVISGTGRANFKRRRKPYLKKFSTAMKNIGFGVKS